MPWCTIHVLVRPYASAIHNIFDGIILQLIVIIFVLPVVEYVDNNYDETLVLVIAYLLVICPITAFITIELWTNWKNIENSYKYLKERCIHKYNVIRNDDTSGINDAEPSIIIHDEMRKNVTIVNV